MVFQTDADSGLRGKYFVSHLGLDPVIARVSGGNCCIWLSLFGATLVIHSCVPRGRNFSYECNCRAKRWMRVCVRFVSIRFKSSGCRTILQMTFTPSYAAEKWSTTGVHHTGVPVRVCMCVCVHSLASAIQPLTDDVSFQHKATSRHKGPLRVKQRPSNYDCEQSAWLRGWWLGGSLGSDRLTP